MPKLYRQGDILIRQLSSKPKGQKARKVRENGVLAEGEATGHMHRVAEGSRAVAYEIGRRLFLAVQASTQVVHDEHNPLTLPKGDYEVLRQREHTKMGRTQRVAD